MHYYIEYGGGLGDIFMQMIYRGSYNVLRDMEPDDTAHIVTICHNPFVHELFSFHPKRNQFRVDYLDYWGVQDDEKYRSKHNLPPSGSLNNLPEKDSSLVLYPNQSDINFLLPIVNKKFIFFHPFAGENNRRFNNNLINNIIETILNETDYNIILVGRNYIRNDKEIENIDINNDRIINAVDRLSVPGTAILLNYSVGMICTHSSFSILGWATQKPMLLLYSDVAYRDHIKNKTQWAFGIDNGLTVHNFLDKYTINDFNNFKQLLN